MKKRSVTQEFDYGCGVACFAFILGIEYKEAVKRLGREQSVKYGWKPSDLIKEFDRVDIRYKNTYVRKKPLTKPLPEGTIVLIERSKTYPFGHYLVLSDGKWMDPWINMPQNNSVIYAKSGFREKLPGRPMYALLPVST